MNESLVISSDINFSGNDIINASFERTDSLPIDDEKLFVGNNIVFKNNEYFYNGEKWVCKTKDINPILDSEIITLFNN